MNLGYQRLRSHPRRCTGVFVAVLVALVLLMGFRWNPRLSAFLNNRSRKGTEIGLASLPLFARQVLLEAHTQVERKTPYREEYHVLAYPGGDVPANEGVCTDLVIRAYRRAGVDLQKELHEDRIAHPEAYPTQIWGNQPADKNIDHRRCQNLTVWFRRHTQTLTTQVDPAHLAEWQPGDVVFFVMPGKTHPWHVALIDNRRDHDGMPFIIEAFWPMVTNARRLDAILPIHSHYRGASKALTGRSGNPS